ncbi:MAG: acetyl-CoA carboxylase biotin carboxyl carrier protein [Rhodospirillaceae bacterium]|nr:acetyl-CoA carboxylase biotin carboxyl carrier protein [Rhodospirillaceae bacterium]
MEKRTFQDINTLIELFENSDWRELSIEVEDFSLHLSRDEGAAGPARQPSPVARERPQDTGAEAPPTAAESTALEEGADNGELDGLTVVRAPNLGLFYRSPKPGAPPYVQIGEEVGEDTEVCLIEVMKLFTPVVAGVSGILRRICVEDGDLVEFDQPLFYVEPQS